MQIRKEVGRWKRKMDTEGVRGVAPSRLGNRLANQQEGAVADPSYDEALVADLRRGVSSAGVSAAPRQSGGVGSWVFRSNYLCTVGAGVSAKLQLCMYGTEV